MSFLDTLKKNISGDSATSSPIFDPTKKAESPFLMKINFKTDPVLNQVKNNALGIKRSFSEMATNDSIVKSKFFQDSKKAGDAIASFVRKPFQIAADAVQVFTDGKLVNNISKIPAVQNALGAVAEHTSGTGIIASIKASSPDVTFKQAYDSMRAYQANDPSKFNKFLYQLGDSGPQTVLGVALNFVPYAGRSLSTAYWTALSADEQIKNRGSVTSVKNLAVDVLGDKVLGASIESILKTPTEALLPILRKSFITEGGTEVAQDLIKFSNDYADAETIEDKKVVVEDTKRYFTSGQILMTLGVGGISGAMTGGGAYTLNQANQFYNQLTPGQKQGGYVNFGFDQSNPIDTVDEIVDTHMKEADIILTDPDLTPETLQQLGGQREVLERAKINLADGLEKINITFQAPLRNEDENKEIAGQVLKSRAELDTLIAEKQQLADAGAPNDTLDRLQTRIDDASQAFDVNSSLVTEAKNSKSVSEFIDSPKTKWYLNKTEPGTLTHATSYENVYDILNSGKIEARIPKGEEMTTKNKSISFSRSKNIETFKDQPIKIIFDEKSIPKTKPTGYKIEEEQRLYDSSLPISSIKRIEISKNPLKESASLTEQKVKDIIDLANEKGIPVVRLDKQGLTDMWNKAQTSNAQPIVTRDTSGQVDKIVDPVNQELVYDSNGPGNVSFGGGTASPANLNNYDKFRTNLSDKWLSFVEQVQNNWVRTERWLKAKGDVLPKDDPTVSFTLYPGRLKTRVQETIDTVKSIDKDIVSTSKKLKMDDTKFQSDLNEYLIAKHAPERNAKLGDNAAGITTKEAEDNLKALESQPHFKEIERVAQKVYDLNKQILEVLYADGQPWGLINNETKSLLESTYKNYVPLNRIFDETIDGDIVNVLSSRGLDVRGSGLKRAKGSEREVSDILTNTAANLVQATSRAEKNFINYQIYKLVEEFPDTVATVRSGVPIGKGFDEKIIFAPENGENILSVMVDGKQQYIDFKSPEFAQTVRGVDIQKMPAALKWIGAYGRLLSQLVTRYSPEFILTNKLRDVQEALVFASAQKGTSGITSISKQALKQLKLDGERAIYDYLMKKDTAGAKLYKQMLEDGGATGGLGMTTRKDVELNIEKIRKTNRSKGRQFMEKVLGAVDGIGEITENSTRLVVYKQALENGLSREEAAVLAKESTVNFDRRGKAGPVINALYMFSNASIQGIAKNLKTLRNPKVLLATLGTILAATWTINKHNEDIDPEWDKKISEFEKAGSVTILLPNKNDKGENYRIVWPLPYGLRFLKVISDEAYNTTTDKKVDVSKSFSRLASSIVDGYNPLSGTDLASTLTPTIGDLPLEVARNKKWSGSKIFPDYNPDLSDSRQYFDSLKDTSSGKLLIGATKYLSDKDIVDVSPETVNYVLEQMLGGTGQFVKKTANAVSSVATGEELPVSEIPFVGKILKEGDPQALDKYGKSEDRAVIKDIKSEKSNESFDLAQQAKDEIANLKGKPKDVISARFQEIQKSNPELLKEIVDQGTKAGKGLTDIDKQLGSLNIQDGGRAAYVYAKLKTLAPGDETRKFLSDLVAKKLINQKVLQQVAELKAQERKQ